MLRDMREAVSLVREDPTTVPYILRTGAQRFSAAGRMMLSSRIDWGTNIYEADWDLLIVLDTCRVDALQHFRDDFSFLREADFGVRRSTGGATLEWLTKTFTSGRSQSISETAYLSGNGWTELIFDRGSRPEDHLNVPWAPTSWNTVDTGAFAHFDNVWRRVEGSNPISDFPRPDSDFMTDAAIRSNRENDFDRTIVHYMQPHAPYVENAIISGRDELAEYESVPFEYLRSGGDRDQVWEAYLTELRVALESVETLLQNFDADEVLVTADHGEAFGEWGVHGHMSGSIHPKVRKVPWIRTTASDTRTRTPESEHSQNVSEEMLEKQLEALGYL